jgi:hypothetical protein
MALIAFLVDVVLILVAKFAPGQAEFVKELLIPINALAAVVIGGIAFEDFAEKLAKKE